MRRSSLSAVSRAFLLIVAFIATTVGSAAHADTYRLAIHPILSPDATRKAYQPMANYLSKTTGQRIELVTAVNFLSYWETVKKDNTYDLALDGAHITDFRVERMGYTVLAKIPDVVSYSVVTHGDTLIIDPQELIGKTIATIGSPSLGAVRLAQLYPNPLRQPVIVEVDNSSEAIDKVVNKEVVAAIVPTPLLRAHPDLNVVSTTEQVPHIALSASPRVPPEVQQAIRDALINASKTPEGQAMLEKVNFPGFEPATSEIYAGYAKLLQGVWGY